MTSAISIGGKSWIVEDGNRVCGDYDAPRVQVLGARARHRRDRRSDCHRDFSRTSRVVVAPTKHSSPVVSGKMPLRNTFGSQAKHDLPSRETSNVVPKPCPAGG